MLEVLVSIVLLAIISAISFQVYSSTLFSWKRSTEVADGLKHGDFSMNNLLNALYSTIYFNNDRRVYAFRCEKSSDGKMPTDMISFVTVSKAFMPASSPYFGAPHRLQLFVDRDDRGNPALFALPMPAIASEEEFAETFAEEPILVSRDVVGLEIFFWDATNEEWTEEWESENSIPERIEISLYISSSEDEEPMQFTRIVDIPVFESVAENLKSPATTTSGTGNTGGANTGGR